MVDRPPTGPSLVVVRREIEQIDRALLLLMAARLDAAGTAIRCRSRCDGRIANPAQEARVLARARKWGASLGLSERFTDPIFRLLIEEGKSRYISGLESAVPAGSLRARVRPRVPPSAPPTPAPALRAKVGAPA